MTKESMNEFSKNNVAVDEMLSDLLPRLSKLYSLRIKLTAAIEETDEAIDEIHDVFKAYGVDWPY